MVVGGGKRATISSRQHGDHIFQVNDLFGKNNKDKKTSSLYFTPSFSFSFMNNNNHHNDNGNNM